MSSDEDRCSICLSDFQCPRVLPCSHSFCHQCLQQYILESYNTADTVGFRCPLCRKHHHPPRPHYPVGLWAGFYPINIFAKLKCQNHDVSVYGICFCHDAHLCFRCLLKLHRTCCLSINPACKAEIVSYFGDLSRKALIWKKRLIDLRRKKKTRSNVAYINQTLVDLEEFLHSMVIDREIIKQETRVSDTIKLISDDFEIFERTVACNVRPQPYSEFCISKQDFTKSHDPLLLQKLLSDDKIIGGFSEESKIFMLSPDGKYICEVFLLGGLISLDIFDDDLIVLLLKVKSQTTTERNCLQLLEYAEKQITPLKSYYLARSYIQVMALCEEKFIALYYEEKWIIDVLQIKNSNIIISDNYILNSNVQPQIQAFDFQYIIYTNDIEVFRVNLQDKTEVCLLSKSRAKINFIERVSCLAVVFAAILITDVVNAVVYKMSLHGTFLTIFLKEKMETREKIYSFHFNTHGNILTCYDVPQRYAYCLYNNEDFDWAEDS